MHDYVSRRKRFVFPRLSGGWKRYAIIGSIVALLILIVWFILIIRQLPRPDSIQANTKYSTIILDKNDKVIYQVYQDKNIIPIKSADIPDYLKKATIAVEDKNFYEHSGFSVGGIMRAFLRNIFLGRREGGSTLTQQLIKNTLLTSDKRIMRKIKEFILAVELERRYTKDQILEMYLNQTPYGGSSYGVGSAAKYYFNKEPRQLTLLEAAILAGLPQSPSRYSPITGEKGAYVERTKQVLRRMREEKYITKDREEELVAQLPKVKFNRTYENIQAAHFVFYVTDQLKDVVGDDLLYKKGLVIKTTLDLDLQREAEKRAREEIQKAKALAISNAAVVAVDSSTGEVRAMVGSIDYNNEKFGKFNAALGLRQPGSTLKPFTYALAFENKYTASTPIMDVKTDFRASESDKSYTPENYDGKYRGPVQLRFALANSLNVPAVKVLAQVGLQGFMQKLYDAGLTAFQPTKENMEKYGLSLTLGGGDVRLVDLVGAYTALANNGTAVRPNAIREVTTYDGKRIYRPPKPEKREIFPREVTFLVSHILSDNVARSQTFGSNSYLVVPGKTVAVKTGTTDDKRDNWTVGYTNNIVVGVWVGNNDNSKMNPSLSSGVSGAAPIWNSVMKYALAHGYKDGIGEKPPKVEAAEIDGFFGGAAKDGYPKRTEYFIEGTKPSEPSPWYAMVKISKSGGKLANAVEIAKGQFEEKLFYVPNETDPISSDGKNRWVEAINAWAKEQSDDKWKVPTETSTENSDALDIIDVKPGENQRVDGNVTLEARVATGKNVESFKLILDGTTEQETKDKKISMSKSLGNGKHTVVWVVKVEGGNETKKEYSFFVNEDPTTPTPTPLLPT